MKLFRMFGCLGATVVAAFFAVIAAMLSVWIMGIAQVELLDASDARSAYQRSALLLTQMQYESRLALVGISDDAAPFTQALSDEIGLLMVELEEYGTVYVEDDPTPLEVDRLRAETVDLITELDASGGEDEELIIATTFAETVINDDMEIIVESAILRFGTAFVDLADIRWLAAIVSIGAMALFPFLALVVFISASRLTRPLLDIANTMVVIAGYNYRDDMLDNLQKKRGSVGELANSVEEMAFAVQKRRSSLEEEASRLRQELYETRRKKLDLVEDAS